MGLDASQEKRKNRRRPRDVCPGQAFRAWVVQGAQNGEHTAHGPNLKASDMPQVAAAHVTDEPYALRGGNLPDADSALMYVAARLLAIAADPATQWSEAGRVSARKAANEMLAQAGERSK